MEGKKAAEGPPEAGSAQREAITARERERLADDRELGLMSGNARLTSGRPRSLSASGT
jgi:hypothetical protein